MAVIIIAYLLCVHQPASFGMGNAKHENKTRRELPGNIGTSIATTHCFFKEGAEPLHPQTPKSTAITSLLEYLMGKTVSMY